MTTPTPCRDDPAQEVIDAVMATMADLFDGDGVCPPKVGGVGEVRFFAGDGAPMAAWDSHVSQGCDEPFVWVRVMRRYRSRAFPAPTIDADPCGLMKVLAVEVGVGWCAVVDQEPKWADYATEAEVSLDVSWRIEVALCRVSKALRNDDSERHVGVDTITPYGPDGGVIAWSAVIYASY